MTAAPKSSQQIKCPHCGNNFSPEAALTHDLKLQMEKEFEKRLDENAQRIIKAEEEKNLKRITSIEADARSKAKRLLELEEKSLSFEERERKLKEEKQQMDLEMRKKLLSKEKEIQEAADLKATERAKVELREKQSLLDQERQQIRVGLARHLQEQAEKVRGEEQMKAAELQKKLDEQTKMINEMKRKSEQGSMQTQGEVQELAIEEFLRTTFRIDSIEEVSKGKRGGDCIHLVKDKFSNLCGKILYESKRTKNFGADWTSKLKDDMRLVQADIGVIVTEVLPADMTRFGLHDGVWVCTYAEFKSLAFLFRDSLCRLGEARATQENKGEKVQMLYDYLTSVEFRQRFEAIVEAFQEMQLDLSKEKAQTMSRWAKREKQIQKAIENTVSVYGDIRGIGGNSIKQIDALEVGDDNLLVEH